MAVKSTVFKVQLGVSDLGRHHYEDYALTLARHPTETDERMLIRIAVFALNAHERLQFTKGLSSAEEPDLWQLGLTGDVEHWIELGQITDKRLRQSCGKAHRVSVYSYQKNAAVIWYESVRSTAERFAQLSVTLLTIQDEGAVAQLIDRSMRLTCVIQDDELTLSNDAHSLLIRLTALKTREDT